MAASFSRLRLLLCAHPFLFILHHAWGSRSWAACQPALYFQLRGIKPQELGIPLTTLANCELGCCRGTGTRKGSSCVLQTRLVCQFHRPSWSQKVQLMDPVVCLLPSTVSLEAVPPWPGPRDMGLCPSGLQRPALEARRKASNARGFCGSLF